MKIIQLYKIEGGDFALDDEGNIYAVTAKLDKSEIKKGVIGLKDELRFIKVRQLFEDRVKE